MHRTTTTATLLVTVAASALSGCVTVHGPAAPGPPAAPSQLSAPRPDGRAEQQIVQAPAREALALIGPSRPPRTTAPAAARPAAPSVAQGQPSPRRDAHPHPPHHESRQPQRPRAAIPGLSEFVRGSVQQNGDVCALGRKYGGWQPDSPEAIICEQAYGH